MMKREVATFGGGCFWCTEALFSQIKGVLSIKSGYSGGSVDNPSYFSVCNGNTGHAEVIQIEYDANIVSYEQLLLIHMTTHNPTTPNQQGADKGTQYRSVILTHSEEQSIIANKVIQMLKPYFENSIITEIKIYEFFYEAEKQHQNYYARNTDKRYCTFVIEPKIIKLREQYKDLLI